MECVRFKIFFDMRVLAALIIGTGIVCPSYAYKYRSNARESINQIFDQVIEQLDRGTQHSPFIHRQRSAHNDSNNFIQSFINNVPENGRSKFETNMVRSDFQSRYKQQNMRSVRTTIKNNQKKLSIAQ